MQSSSRRRFLKLAGVSAAGLSAKPVLDVMASDSSESQRIAPQVKTNEKSLTAKQWALVVDTAKFHGPEDLEPLIEVCHKIHNVPQLKTKNHEIKWIWETEYKHAFPSRPNQFLPEKVEHRPFLVLCNHCENPPCVRACPTQATFKRGDDGIVMMDFHRCIGCRFCMAACPFGARSFNFRDPHPFVAKQNKEFPTRMKGVVEKCNFCAERLAVGKVPACVEASNGALVFGDLYDPDSEVRKLLKTRYTIRRKVSLGTEPSVYYII
jgi:molybdopterin-containing oxidoreductase family iron-sulfur binding subunit